MSTRRFATAISIPESEVEPTCVLRWQGHGCLGFEDSSIMVRDAYGDTVDDDALVIAGRGVFSLVYDDSDWNMSDTSISRNADVPVSLRVHLTATQS